MFSLLPENVGGFHSRRGGIAGGSKEGFSDRDAFRGGKSLIHPLELIFLG
jgi:hypothetical protein